MIVQAPLNRKGNIILRDSVTTVSTPGRYFVDFIMTPDGMIVNDQKTNAKAARNIELKKKMQADGVKFISMDEAVSLAKSKASEFPKPLEPVFGDRVVGVVKYLDGTALDSIREVKNVEEIRAQKGK